MKSTNLLQSVKRYKYLLFIISIFIFSLSVTRITEAQVGANVAQIHYSLRDDDGSEDAATFLNSDLSAIDTDSSEAVSVGNTFRIRFELSNEGSQHAPNVAYTLQYAALDTYAGCTDIPDGDFSDVPVDTSTEPVEMVTTSYYSDGDKSSNCTTVQSCDLPDENARFSVGDLIADPSNAINYRLRRDRFTEFEYSVAFTNNITYLETYCFRLSSVDTYLEIPGVIATGYASSGTYISSYFDAGAASAFNVIEWDWSMSDAACTVCDIQFQIQTAPDAGGAPGAWSSTWCGPEGEDGDETDFFTVSTGELIHTDHNGDQWIRYRAIFSGDWAETPILEEVRFYYQ